jgi:hypothetical protein
MQVVNGRSVVGHRSPLSPSQVKSRLSTYFTKTRENERMTCQVPSRLVSYRRYETVHVENTKPDQMQTLVEYHRQYETLAIIQSPTRSIFAHQSTYISIYIYTDPSGPGSERRLFLCLHQVPILAQTQQVSLQHGDRHLPYRGYVDRGLPSQ